MTAINNIKTALDIYYAIIWTRKIQHLKPSFSKIMDHLVQKEFINIQGDGSEESILVNKSLSDFLQNFYFETKNCETQMDQEKGNINAYKNNEEATGIKE